MHTYTGVSVVEDLDKAREPLPLAAVYYITPSPASVQRLLADFADKPLYPSVHVFFSNRVTPDAVEKIKRSKVGPRLTSGYVIHAAIQSFPMSTCLPGGTEDL
eukprot:GHRR01023154.1.p2 GENE.GHRR01023154.1~~GHRR01023154.1.p2  ORF type:complete len:103 (+),score=27.22 GHRR01023154.1:907-1215(+)